METNACGHIALAGTSLMCPHLINDEEWPEFVALLTGQGIGFDVCCPACDAADTPPDLLTVCEGCVVRVTEDHHGLTAWRGTPGVAERPEPVDRTVHRTALPDDVSTAIDLAPLPHGRWLLLLPSPYRLVAFDPRTGDTGPVVEVPLAVEDHGNARREPTARAHVSADGRFAAVAHDFGRRGVVVDLDRGTTALELDRGEYHVEQTPYPLAFAGAVLHHATAWNQITTTDLVTGISPTTDGPGYNYFHGRMVVSPTGRWVADDGWVWSPAGMPHVWDRRGGPPGLKLCQRHYRWNVGMCWVGDDLLAIAGIGPDDEIMLDGVRVFDAESGLEVTAFAGPRGTFFADDRRLYSASPDGLEIWDPATGERTGSVPGFTPTAHGDGELAALSEGGLLRWRTGR